MFLQPSNSLFQGVYLCAGCLAAGTKQPLWLAWRSTRLHFFASSINHAALLPDSRIYLPNQKGTPARWNLIVDVAGLGFGPMPLSGEWFGMMWAAASQTFIKKWQRKLLKIWNLCNYDTVSSICNSSPTPIHQVFLLILIDFHWWQILGMDFYHFANVMRWIRMSLRWKTQTATASWM